MSERSVTLTVEVPNENIDTILRCVKYCDAMFMFHKPARTDGKVKVTVSFDDFNHYHQFNQHLKSILEKTNV